ncbi:MAG TPA: CHASE3 domain-containing protein [Candidatus Polarisedimenticolia bacterium]|nr:CHASE3 domain-containing protein [Candidatus Polarisedimenticolia bacterium]
MIRKAALQIGIPALLVFIGWNAYLAVNHLNRVQTIAALTLESSAIQAELSGVLRDMTDMETSQRGYLLTGNPAYLQPYTEAKGRIGTDFSSLRTGLASRTQREQSLASRLEALAGSKQAEIERSIGLRQQGYRHRSFMLVDTNEGKDYMDEIRRIVSSLSAAESSNYARFDRDRIAALKSVLSLTVVSNSVLLVLAAGLFGLIRQHLRLLGEKVSQSRIELAVRDLQLEKLTSALSGQARSNIGAINTNSRLLLENYGDFLPRQGHEYAEQMNEAAAQMERLRQDLVGSQVSASDANAA